MRFLKLITAMATLGFALAALAQSAPNATSPPSVHTN